MNYVSRAVKRSIKICKLNPHRARCFALCKRKKCIFVNKLLYKGYYTHRVIKYPYNGRNLLGKRYNGNNDVFDPLRVCAKQDGAALFFIAFNKYVAWTRHHDKATNTDEIKKDMINWSFIVSYIMAGDGVSDKEREYLTEFMYHWGNGLLTINDFNEIINNASKESNHELVMTIAKELSLQNKTNVLKESLYAGLVFAGVDGLHPLEIERFNEIGLSWNVTQKELDEILQLFYVASDLLAKYKETFM
eukprot:66692_1